MSPAAAAAISRVLAGAGIPKAREIAKGWETEGYATELRADCIEVQWVPGLFELSEDADRALIAEGLTRCQAALGKYEVERVVRDVAYSGGWRPNEVLEVRRG